MQTSNAELLPLLREAISELVNKPHNDLRPVLQAALDTLGKNRLYNDHDLMHRIGSALEESAPAATPVAEPADVWWQDKVFRAVFGSAHLIVQSKGPRVWYWGVSFSDRTDKHGLYARQDGTAPTEDEAKEAAYKVAREKR